MREPVHTVAWRGTAQSTALSLRIREHQNDSALVIGELDRHTGLAELFGDLHTEGRKEVGEIETLLQRGAGAGDHFEMGGAFGRRRLGDRLALTLTANEQIREHAGKNSRDEDEPACARAMAAGTADVDCPRFAPSRDRAPQPHDRWHVRKGLRQGVMNWLGQTVQKWASGGLLHLPRINRIQECLMRFPAPAS